MRASFESDFVSEFSGVVWSATASPTAETIAVLWSRERFPPWYRVALVTDGAAITWTDPSVRLWGAPRWSPTGRLAVGAFVGLRRVVLEIAVPGAGAEVMHASDAHSYELVDWPRDEELVCNRFASDGRRAQVTVSAGQERITSPELQPRHDWAGLRVVTWRHRGCEFEGLFIPPTREVRRPWPVVTFLHGGPVGALAVGQQEDVLASPFPSAALFIPEFPASGICGETEMVRAFEAAELPSHDPDVEAVLSGIAHLAGDGLIDPERHVLVGHSYGAYLVNRAATRGVALRGAVCVDGVADLHLLDGVSLALQQKWRGGTPSQVPDRWAAANPIEWAASVTMPMLLIYAGQGPLIAQAERWAGALAPFTSVELRVDLLADHAFSGPARDRLEEIVIAFIERLLGDRPPGAGDAPASPG